MISPLPHPKEFFSEYFEKIKGHQKSASTHINGEDSP